MAAYRSDGCCERKFLLLIFVFCILLFCCFKVFRPQFIKPDGISITLHRKDIFETSKESFIVSSLFVYRVRKPFLRYRRKSLLLVMLLICGDIESCPGPTNIADFCNSKGLNVVHQNIRGLLNNFSNLEAFVSMPGTKIDVISLSETHIVDGDFSDNDELFNLPGYTFVKRNRKSGKGGGVAAFVKNGLNFKRREDLETTSLESLWLEIIFTKSKSVLIGCFYRPPVGSNYLPHNYNALFNDHVEQIVEKGRKEIIMLGDFNINYRDKNCDKEFKSIVNTLGFSQLVDKATRITHTSSTLIDLILSNRPENISTISVFTTSFSDHDMVGCVRKLNNIKYPMRSIKCRDYSKYNHENLSNDVKKINWEPVYKSSDVNSAVTYFNSELRKVFDKYAPIIEKRIKGKPCKWLNSDLRKEMNNRDKQMRNARKTNSDEDWTSYRKMRNECNKNVKRAKSNYHQDILKENITNPQKFWNAVKAIFPSKSRKISNISHDKKEQTSAVDKFSQYFSTVVKSLKTASIPLTDSIWRFTKSLPSRTENSFTLDYVSIVFIEKELRSLKRQKATGIDELPPGLLRDCAKGISKPICHIINLSIQTSTVPSIWKVAKISPVFKSGVSTLPENYRPISVLPVLYKLLEKAVHSKLMNFLEKGNLLSDSQYGFRNKRSTKMAATLLCDNIRRKIDIGEMVGTIYIDLSKAFDTIGHGILLQKLPAYGIRNKELSWFTDYLFNRKQIVEINNIRSISEPIYCGVPQGSILGPLLFILFFNDFVDHVKHSSVIKYADDTVIFLSHTDIEKIERLLNEDMGSIASYLGENELIINLKIGKTEVMLYGTAKRLKNHGRKLKIMYRDEPINVVSSYKYLGNIVDNHLSLNENFSKVYKKASNRLRLLSRMKSYLTSDARLKIYEMMIIPLITYSSSIHLRIAKRVPVEHPQFAGENIGNIPYRNKFWRICRIR